MSTIIVVEGTHDEAKIKEVYPNAFVMVTGGSAISQAFLDELKALSINNEIVLFLDPDFPGEKIRRTISDVIPSAKHAFVKKQVAISKNKKKVGVEHVDNFIIKESLDNLIDFNYNQSDLNMSILFENGLIGDANSSILRNKISSYLNIGTPNGKTFLERLRYLGITKKKLEELIETVKMYENRNDNEN